MKHLYLFYLADPSFGGWISYTVHLAKSFGRMGVSVYLFKVGKRDESFTRPFSGGLVYQNVSLEMAKGLCGFRKSFITAIGQNHTDSAAALIQAGAGACIHDPTEITKPMIEALSTARKPIVTIRKANLPRVEKASGKKAVFIPHPYCTSEKQTVEKTRNAVAISRLDWDKNTLTIAAANALLSENEKIHIFGAENRLYTHHKIDKEYPEWRKNYCGRFSKDFGSSLSLCRSANYVVDLSVIAGDGGGTQYTFLEAWETGTPLIVHKKWLRDDDKTLEHGRNCYAVETPQELADALRKKLKLESSVEEHRPEVIVPLYMDAI